MHREAQGSGGDNQKPFGGARLWDQVAFEHEYASAEHDGHVRDVENSGAQGPIPTFMKSITIP